MTIIEDKKTEFEGVIEHLKSDLAQLRTSRASPAMVEDLRIDYYGVFTPLKQLGNISVPEPQQLLITPWDKNALAFIEKAIRDSDLGLNPANEGDKIRIVIPKLTQERRLELTKVASRIAEEGRVRLRNVREEIWKEIKKQESAGKVSEDEKFRLQDKLQEIVDKYNKQIKELAEAKEKEIMTIWFMDLRSRFYPQLTYCAAAKQVSWLILCHNVNR